MMIVKPPPGAYAVKPEKKDLQAMGRYTDELRRAGVLLEMAGLDKDVTRVKFAGSSRAVTDGPFSETKELIGGFWIIQVRSKEEALEWVRRIPLGTECHVNDETEVELRRIVEPGELA
ncbi:MAG TPA: YciI family protein [Kofleriaceae bacterium]